MTRVEQLDRPARSPTEVLFWEPHRWPTGVDEKDLQWFGWRLALAKGIGPLRKP